MFCVIAIAILSCCSNVVLLEILIRENPGCGNVITFFQFLFVACEGFIFTCKFGTVKSVVPLRNYAKMVIMFFAVSVSNNYALNFNIPMPLHMIFKSGSLITSMLLGMIILKRRYSITKYFSVFMISVGIFIATWATQTLKVDKNGAVSDHVLPVTDSFVGLFLLSFALFVSAGLGIYQETIYRRYGKHPREALFYSHTLPLPGFLILAQDIYSHLPLFSTSSPIQVPILGSIPKLWLCLLGNVLTQYACVRSVFIISSKYSSLTVTMIITLRKFISLLISILYFKNQFTSAHWIGTLLVFTGILLFADVSKLVRSSSKEKHS